MPYFLGLIFLTNLRDGGDFAPLSSALIFASMGGFALIAVILAHYFAKIRPFKWWDGNFGKDDLKYIVVGYGGLITLAIALTPVFAGSLGIILALAGGRILLFYTLKKTESILVPWFVHTIYNTTAIALAGFSLIQLSASALYVPNFTLDGVRAADFATQAFMQFFFVAFAEEMLVISIALGFYYFTKSKMLAMGVSTVAWVVLHTILSYPINLPF